jgi:hypothetical protein
MEANGAAEFVFSVRCHQGITHRIGLKPVDEAFEVFYKMKVYCDVLEAPFLVEWFTGWGIEDCSIRNLYF